MERHHSLSQHLTAFAGYLRNRGYQVGLDEVSMALQALGDIDIGNKAAFITVLKLCFCRNKQQWEALPDHYADFWKAYQRAVDSKEAQIPKEEMQSRPVAEPVYHQVQDIRSWWRQGQADVLEKAFYSPFDDPELRTLQHLETDEGSELAHWVRVLARKLARHQARRTVQHARRGKLDMRVLLQNRFKRGDELLHLRYRLQIRDKAKMLLLCDVSKSMDMFSAFFTLLLHQLQHYFDDLAVYVFNTRLHPLPQMRKGVSWKDQLQQLEAIPGLWSGGTRIGASLYDLRHQELPAWFDRRTRVLIFSDGWDTGEPEVLQDALFWLRQHAGLLFWFNPVIQDDRQLELQAMRLAESYLDYIAPVYNLMGLKDFIRRL